jgi:hypothetical protein
MSEATEEDGGRKLLEEAAAHFSNWGKWGPDDQAGTVNYITPEDIRGAAGLIRREDVFSLAIPFDQNGPQTGSLRRFNAMSFMLRDGDDVFSRDMTGVPRGIGAADDVVIQATHGATHWDALAHYLLRLPDVERLRLPARQLARGGAQRHRLLP